MDKKLNPLRELRGSVVNRIFIIIGEFQAINLTLCSLCLCGDITFQALDGKKVIRFIFMMVCLLALIGCQNNIQKELVLFDFESDKDLDRVHWKCHTLLSLSSEHATHGEKSLKLELYPSAYPGLNPVLDKWDWRDYSSLRLDFFNPGKEDISITVRIDDKGDADDYEDRYNRNFLLQPGINHIEILMNSLVTSGTNRQLDLRKIQKYLFFMVNPTQKVILYVDNIRLNA